jgi:hypothetical protein
MTTVAAALAKFESYIGKDRKELPWLKELHAPNMLDCAAGYSWIVGLHPLEISCGKLADIMKHNKTWTTVGLPKAGDAVIFHWNAANKNETDHVGMVKKAKWTDKTKKHFIVYYVSADSTQPVPGKVSYNSNGVHSDYVTGWGQPKKFDAPVVAPKPVVEPAPVVETPVAAPVSPVETTKPVVAPVTPVAPVEAPKPVVEAPKPALVEGVDYVVAVAGDSYWAIAAKHLKHANVFGINNEMHRLQALNHNAAIKVGSHVKLK